MSQARPVARDGLPLGCLSPHALYTKLCVTRCTFLAPSLAPLLSLSVPVRAPRVLPGARSGGALCVGKGVWWGLGGGVDASIGPRPPASPLGGADVCTPRRGVTFLYGLSTCTRFVQMDLRRS